jgi:hypothetical protein
LGGHVGNDPTNSWKDTQQTPKYVHINSRQFVFIYFFIESRSSDHLT